MCSYTSRAAALALLVGALACSDRPPGTAPDAAGGPNVLSTATNPELLARSLALALGDPAFRAHVKGELDRSPCREHKLSFQRFLTAGRGHALAAMAQRSGVATADLARTADGAIPLEMYLPVPEHRRAWKGDANVLVATAVADHDPPMAFDVQGNRLVLDLRAPPGDPGDRRGPGRDRLFDHAGRHRVPVVWRRVGPATSTHGAGPVPHESPFRGRL